MSASTVARTEFAAAIAQIANERKISTESIYSGIKTALVAAYRKQVGELEEGMHHFATVNEETGEAKVFEAPILKQDEETLEVLEYDHKKAREVTPPGFGRIAAQTAKQVILQKIREAEKDQVIADFQDRIGEIITGTVLRMEGRMVVIDLGRGYAYMPPEEQMRGEFYRMNMRIVVLVKEIADLKRGRCVVVSRADQNLVTKLFEREVPEVAAGSVQIVSIAREAGVRTKIAVSATQEGVDPVGSCVGQRGVRVQEVIKELNNEKVDIIPHSDNPVLYLQGALAPAEALLIEVDQKQDLVTVTAPDDQLSLAIGRGGQNVRLAAKLTGYKITIKSAAGEVASHATGEEEYEIDTIKGLSDEVRSLLITYKLTTFADLDRFRDKWQDNEEINEQQQQLLTDSLEEFAKKEREYEESRGFGKKDAEATTAGEAVETSPEEAAQLDEAEAKAEK